MRNPDPTFWPDTEVDLSLRQRREKNYTDCINILQTQWYQADLDQRFAMGDQDLWGLIFPGVATYRRKIFNFNLVNSHLQMISGYQRRNRKSTVCVPVLPEMQKTADQFTKCLYHVHKDGLYQIYSDAFEQGALTQGLGFVQFYKSLKNDPVSGDICARYVDMKSCLFDPYFRRADLSDMRFWWTRQFFDREEAAVLYSDFADEILALPKGTYRDDKFYYMPEVYQIQFPNLIAFDEYWYLSSRDAEILVDKSTGETQEFTGDEEDLLNIMRMFKERLAVVKTKKPTVRRTIILNDRVLIDEPNPLGIDRYPVTASLAYFTPDSPYYAYKFRGVVRDIRDAQYLFNRRKVTDLDILESQQQGLKIRQGSLVTPDDAFNQGNGRALFYKKEGNPEDIQPMPIVPPAPTMIQMEQMLQDVMSRITGVNETMLGADINDKAGIISMLRNSAGVTTLTRLFDQFDEFQRQCGDLIIEIIQKNWTYGKVKQVIGEEPTPEFDNKAFANYGCKVIQGSLTETQQQMELGQIINLNEIMATNPPPPLLDRIIDCMFIQNKDKLKEGLAQFQKYNSEQQQKMAELQMQQMQVDNATKMSYAQSQQSLAKEREAKIQLDQAVNVERIARSREDKTASILNLVKAAKELKGLDLDHLAKEISLLSNLSSMSQPNLEESLI